MGFTSAALCPTCCWPCKPLVSHIISAACLVKSYKCCHFTHVSFFMQKIMGKLDFLPHRVRHQVKHEVSTKSCYLLVMHGVYLALLYHLAWWPKAECPCHALLNYHCWSMLTSNTYYGCGHTDQYAICLLHPTGCVIINMHCA